MNKFQFLAVCIFLAGFSAYAQNLTAKQGIQGKVLWIEGNQMPGPGVERDAGKPIQRKLYIYEAVKQEQAATGASPVFVTQVQARLVKKVKTGPDGRFKAELPPGFYSLFSMEPDGLWANTYDGDGYINPVRVEEGKFTNMQLVINYRAYY